MPYNNFKELDKNSMSFPWKTFTLLTRATAKTNLSLGIFLPTKRNVINSR